MLRKIALGALFALPFMAIAQVSNPGVSSINGQRGAFTFTGAVTCTLMTCNFTGGGGGGGTVTSVVDSSGLFSIANPTTVPTFTYNAVPANTFLAGPASGGNAAPLFRVLGVSDLPSTTLSAAGSPTSNTLTKWVTSNTIGNSSIVDNGSTVSTTEQMVLSAGASIASGQVLNWNSVAGISSSGAGVFAFGNGTNGNASATINANIVAGGTASAVSGSGVLMSSGAVAAFTNSASYAGTRVSGISSCGTACIAVGNGTAGNVSGTSESGSFLSNVATGTAPLTVTSTTPVINMVVSKHPTVQYCGLTGTCSATAQANGQIVFGSAVLVTGTPSTVTVSGISPAFVDTAYICTVTSKSNPSATTTLFSVNNITTSSFQIIGTATSTDTVGYICVH